MVQRNVTAMAILSRVMVWERDFSGQSYAGKEITEHSGTVPCQNRALCKGRSRDDSDL